MKQSPIFTRTYDLLRWLLPATAKFPREHRFILATALQRKAFDLHEALIDAGQGNDAPSALKRADASLVALRTYLRLARDLRILSDGQYEHAARLVEEIGRLLGGWIKVQNKSQQR